jgi:hypothetical protein
VESLIPAGWTQWLVGRRHCPLPVLTPRHHAESHLYHSLVAHSEARVQRRWVGLLLALRDAATQPSTVTAMAPLLPVK